MSVLINIISNKYLCLVVMALLSLGFMSDVDFKKEYGYVAFSNLRVKSP